jgi:hypothetical protein
MTVDQFDELISGFGGASPLTTQQALQRMYLDRQQSGLDQKILHFLVLNSRSVLLHDRLSNLKSSS